MGEQEARGRFDEHGHRSRTDGRAGRRGTSLSARTHPHHAHHIEIQMPHYATYDVESFSVTVNPAVPRATQGAARAPRIRYMP